MHCILGWCVLVLNGRRPVWCVTCCGNGGVVAVAYVPYICMYVRFYAV